MEAARRARARSRRSGSTARSAGCSSSSSDLGLFTRRTVSLDSIPVIVGTAEFQAEAPDDRRAVDRDGEGRRRASIYGLRSRAPAAHAGDLRRGGEPDGRAWRWRRELRAQGFAVTRRPALARERRRRATTPPPRRSGEIRWPCSPPPTGRSRAAARIGLPPRARRAHRAAAARDVPTDSRLARQSVPDLRPARGGLLPHRLALEPGHRARPWRGRSPARRRSPAGSPSPFPRRTARGWGAASARVP